MAIAPLTILLLIIVVVIVLLRRSKGTSLRGPRKRHIVTRIVCGVLGFGILIAVGIGSWQEMHKPYAADASELTVKVPANDPPPAQHADNRGRFLHYILVVNASGGLARPVHAEMFEFNLPDDLNREFRAGFSVDGVEMAYTATPIALRPTGVSRTPNKPVVRMSVSFYYNISDRTSGSRSGHKSYTVGSIHHLKKIRRPGRASGSPLAALPSSRADLLVYGRVLRASENDPLKSVPLAEFVGRYGPQIDDNLERYRAGRQRFSRKADIPAHGAALATHVGPAAALLVAAAFLLAQLFTRRHIAFPAVLAAVVLYVAAIDRVALGVNLSYAEDKDAPIAVRLLGCARARDTFFYGKTAERRTQAVIDDPNTPSQLRELATRIAGGSAP